MLLGSLPTSVKVCWQTIFQCSFKKEAANGIFGLPNCILEGQFGLPLFCHATIKVTLLVVGCYLPMQKPKMSALYFCNTFDLRVQFIAMARTIIEVLSYKSHEWSYTTWISRALTCVWVTSTAFSEAINCAILVLEDLSSHLENPNSQIEMKFILLEQKYLENLNSGNTIDALKVSMNSFLSQGWPLVAGFATRTDPPAP